MPEKVIEKIASQAATEVGVGGGTSGGVLGIGGHTDLHARPKVDVQLSGRTATMELDLALRYPTPIRRVTEQARQHVTTRVEELTGVQVTRLDVTVAALSAPSATDRQEGLR